MPFVRVSYLENKYDAEQLPNISRDIMSALVEHFNVPEDDFFKYSMHTKQVSFTIVQIT